MTRTSPSPPLAAPPLPLRPLLPAFHLGRYLPRRSPSDEDFVGIELKACAGKNDGSLEGKRYFMADKLHGIFVRPAKCRWQGLVEETGEAARAKVSTN